MCCSVCSNLREAALCHSLRSCCKQQLLEACKQRRYHAELQATVDTFARQIELVHLPTCYGFMIDFYYVGVRGHIICPLGGILSTHEAPEGLHRFENVTRTWSGEYEMGFVVNYSFKRSYDGGDWQHCSCSLPVHQEVSVSFRPDLCCHGCSSSALWSALPATFQTAFHGVHEPSTCESFVSKKKNNKNSSRKWFNAMIQHYSSSVRRYPILSWTSCFPDQSAAAFSPKPRGTKIQQCFAL